MSNAVVEFDKYTLARMECGGCGISYAVPQAWLKDRKRNHETFYCPNGCPRHFPGESDIERERRLREEAERRAEGQRLWRKQAIDRADRAERSAAAYKGHLTRTKRRVGNGVCPCCNRHFKNLADHMAGQHPEYVEP